jgi:toxin ParE1/3/4
MNPAVFSRRALRELDSAVTWIATDNPVAAEGLRAAVVRAAERIGRHPHIGSLRPDLTTSNRHRFVVLTGFPYLIVYAADREPPLIVRVVHTARELPRLLRDLG